MLSMLQYWHTLQFDSKLRMHVYSWSIPPTHTHMHIHIHHTHTHCVIRRQKELITPLLFEVAHSGNKDLLFKILENGDDVNPIVREIP